jgi:hypothetical protein
MTPDGKPPALGCAHAGQRTNVCKTLAMHPGPLSRHFLRSAGAPSTAVVRPGGASRAFASEHLVARLQQVLAEIEAQVESVPAAVLVMAARRLDLLAAPHGIPPPQLDAGAVSLGASASSGAAAAPAARAAQADAGSEAGSMGSLEAAMLDDSSDSGSDAALCNEVEWFDAQRLYPGGPVVNTHHTDDFAPPNVALVPADAADAAAGDADDADDGAWRDNRLGAAHGIDSIGLGDAGSPMFCDYCDLGGGVAIACMAQDMLQQRRMSATVEKHQRKRTRSAHADPDGREARHDCYREVIA